jgi:Rrf2 family transcriptional regulator, cysteine metabolism repressor
MKVSVKSQYALEALLDMRLHTTDEKMSIRDTAQRRGISEHYLEQIFSSLRKAGIVASERGALGGYRWAKPFEEITAGDVIRAVEGPLCPVKCLCAGTAQQAGCELYGRCVTRLLWENVMREIDRASDAVTLGDLAEKLRAMCGEQSLEYSI